MNENIEEMVKIIEDRKIDVLSIKDVRELSTFAEYFIIAIADNDRQLNGLVNEFKSMKEQNIYVEGEGNDGWVAIQKDDVCAHVFSYQTHEEYRLDKLFEDQPTVE